jgi:hypothetical protein
MFKASSGSNEYLFNHRPIVINVFMDFDFSLASNSFVRWIGIINTIRDDILPS